MMGLWMDLLFGNPVGLLSMIVVISTFIIICYILWMFYKKSGEKPDNTPSGNQSNSHN